MFGLFVGERQRAHVRDAAVPGALWWLAVDGACWRAPEGPGSEVRQGFGALLAAQPDIEVVGDAADGADALTPSAG